MTHSGGKEHRVGDEGQRYEVRATGWPRPGKTTVCLWTDNRENAQGAADRFKTHAPGCTNAWVVDRRPGETRPPSTEEKQ